MFLLQTKQTLPITQDNLISIVPINYNTSIIVYGKCVQLYEQLKNEAIGSIQISSEKDQEQGRQIEIFECQYHSHLKSLILVLSSTTVSKGLQSNLNNENLQFCSCPNSSSSTETKKWLIGTINIDQSSLSPIKVIWDFSKHSTPYENMQLLPRLIIMSHSNYWVLVRHFYNDSQCIVFNQQNEEKAFFINEENIESFDDRTLLVNKRGYFTAQLQIDIIDISNTDPKKDQIRHRIPVNGSGLLMKAKNIDKSKILIGINWKQKYSEISIYDSQSKKFTFEASEEHRLLKIFWFSSQEFIILTYQNGETKLKLFEINKNKIVLKNQIESDLQFEQWLCLEDKENFLLYNFTLRESSNAETQMQITKIYRKEEGLAKILSQYCHNEIELASQIYQLLFF